MSYFNNPDTGSFMVGATHISVRVLKPSVMFITHHLLCFWKSIMVLDDLNELTSRQLSFAMFFSKKEDKDPSSTLPFRTKTPAEKPAVL